VAVTNGRPGPVRDLPHDAMAERSVVGSMLVDPECVPSLLGTLRPRDFFVPQHAVLFMAIDRTLRARGTVDSLSVVDELRATDRLLDAGGEVGWEGQCFVDPLGHLRPADGPGCPIQIDTLGHRARGPGPEDEALEQRITRQAIRPMDSRCRYFPGGPQSR
jgi:hypothetical protein